MTAVLRAGLAGPERLDRFESQMVFRILLETASRPGQIRQLPFAGLGASVVPLALADVETTIAVTGSASEEARVLRATGAKLVPLAEAGLVACCGGTDAEAVDRLRRGSALAPELGAKVGIDCGTLHPAPIVEPGADLHAAVPPVEHSPAGLDSAEVSLQLRGPGIDGTTTLGVSGLDRSVFEAIHRATAAFPAGIDVWLIDERGRIAALPRSTRWTVS